MGNIDTKRITSISDGGNAVPVQWSVNATDIKYNNAIIMATTIARRIDKQYLWNGLITNTEKVRYFNINPKTKKIKMNPSITDTLIFNKQVPLPLTIEERVDSVKIKYSHKMSVKNIKESFPAPTQPRLPLTSTPLFSKNEGTKTIYIEMRNPINIGEGSEEENKNAFSVLVTVDTQTYYPIITNVSLETGLNVIIINLEEEIMSQSTQNIAVIYNSELGTIEDSFNGGKIASFQTSFIYTETTTE